jgi:ubiquinone/menaquinone biosynthesis C-methylase UbiE
MTFKDHFSDRATLYSQYRPHYPPELFDWIASLVSRHEVVWDCAAGSGQASVSLAEIFDRVIATDASEKQISMAAARERIEYRVAPADRSGLSDKSVDMVTVAQAIHWFEHNAFYDEVRRVLRPEGAIAIWGYGDPIIEDPGLDRIVHEYNRGTIEDYWMPERDLLLAGLRTIAFPFREIAAPSFEMKHEWTLEQLTGYLRTWSATAAYARVLGSDPVIPVEEELKRYWGSGRRLVVWPLHIRAGYVEAELRR